MKGCQLSQLKWLQFRFQNSDFRTQISEIRFWKSLQDMSLTDSFTKCNIIEALSIRERLSIVAAKVALCSTDRPWMAPHNTNSKVANWLFVFILSPQSFQDTFTSFQDKTHLQVFKTKHFYKFSRQDTSKNVIGSICFLLYERRS